MDRQHDDNRCLVAGLLPDEAQDEIFADPDTRFCGSVGPNGIATPTEGDYILNGKWHFNTGTPHAQWDAQLHPDSH